MSKDLTEPIFSETDHAFVMGNPLNYLCVFCLFSFPFRSKCDQCDYSHYIRDRYNRHHRYHSMDHIRCKLCEFQTIYRWNLERHMRHHTDTMSFGFRCNKCNFTASTKQSITAHEIAHHNGVNIHSNLSETLQMTEMEDNLFQNELKPVHIKDIKMEEECHFDASDFLEVVMDEDSKMKGDMAVDRIKSELLKDVKKEPISETFEPESKHLDRTKIFYCINCSFRYF